MFSENPLISIITVSYNAVASIEETIQSVINQTYYNIEYIIIDGGSTDGTVDIIEKYSDKIAYWVSEPDKGIYDAMNKGIVKASGEWINFMNSGDLFADSHVLDKIFALQKNDGASIIYGNSILKYDWGKYLSVVGDLEELYKGMIFIHQSTFIRRKDIINEKYNLKYKLCADYNYFLNSLLIKRIFKYVPIPISIYEAEYGLSSKNKIILLEETFNIRKSLLHESNSVSMYLRVFKIKILQVFKILIPNKFVVLFRKWNLKRKYLQV